MTVPVHVPVPATPFTPPTTVGPPRPPATPPRPRDETPIDLSLLDIVLEEFRGRRLAVIPLLQRTQDQYGYVPKAALAEIARRTRIPLSQLFGVATFYAQFRLHQRGRHLVRVCDGTACHVRGAPKSIETIRKALGVETGQTSADRKISLDIVYCLGSCGLAPVVVVDEKVHGRVEPGPLLDQLRRLP